MVVPALNVREQNHLKRCLSALSPTQPLTIVRARGKLIDGTLIHAVLIFQAHYEKDDLLYIDMTGWMTEIAEYADTGLVVGGGVNASESL